jgi:predicted MFS family arabinose efflux permease
MFWSTAMVAIVATFVSYVVIPDALAKGAPGMSARHFDFYGCITGVSGLILINFSLNQAPLVGWNTPYVYFLFIIGVLLVGGFFYIELNLAKHPLVPIRGLQPQAILTLACIAAGWASHGIWVYYLFMFQMRVRGDSAIIAAAELIPVAPIGVAFALSTNYLIKRIQVSRVMLLAMLFFFVGTIFLVVAPANQTYWALTFISVIVMPGGMNLSFPAGTILLSSSMPREHQGKAASMISTIVNYSIASGLGIAGSVERSINYDGKHRLESYRGAWYVGMGFSGLGLLISFYFVWHLRTRKP